MKLSSSKLENSSSSSKLVNVKPKPRVGKTRSVTLAAMSQEFERVIDPNEIRNSNCKMTKQSGPFSIVMTTVQKSPNDKREYRLIYY